MKFFVPVSQLMHLFMKLLSTCILTYVGLYIYMCAQNWYYINNCIHIHKTLFVCKDDGNGNDDRKYKWGSISNNRKGMFLYFIHGNDDSTGTSRSTVTVETRKIIITIIL